MPVAATITWGPNPPRAFQRGPNPPLPLWRGTQSPRQRGHNAPPLHIHEPVVPTTPRPSSNPRAADYVPLLKPPLLSPTRSQSRRNAPPHFSDKMYGRPPPPSALLCRKSNDIEIPVSPDIIRYEPHSDRAIAENGAP
jgi:hypothetical protein